MGSHAGGQVMIDVPGEIATPIAFANPSRQASTRFSLVPNVSSQQLRELSSISSGSEEQYDEPADSSSESMLDSSQDEEVYEEEDATELDVMVEGCCSCKGGGAATSMS